MPTEVNSMTASGETSPYKETCTSGPNTSAVAETDDTDISSNIEYESVRSRNYPGPPFNSPEGTTVGDAFGVDAESITEKLARSFSTATTIGDARAHAAGKPHLRARIDRHVPLLQQLFKAPAVSSHKRSSRMTRCRETEQQQQQADKQSGTHTPGKPDQVEDLTVAAEEYPEYSTWEQVATEDVGQALMRLAMLAKDEHKKDESKSVEEIYSARLAQLIQEAEVAFDPKYLN